MMKGREIVFLAVAFVAGAFLGDLVPFSAAVYLTAAALSSLVSCLFRKDIPFLLSFVLLGAAALQIERIPGADAESQLTVWAAALQARFSSFLETLVPPGEDLAVLKALAIGDRSDLTGDIRSIYKTSGAMHFLALSGLHVGIIYAFMKRLLSLLGGYAVSRVLRSSFTLAFLWFFALVSGFGPSIARAVTMITVHELSGAVSGTRNAPASMAASALLITLLRPESPLDIGFQLSYSAVISIYLILPRLKSLLYTESLLLGYVWSALCLAISCQATCGVLAWFYFGTFPRYFLLTNLMVVPIGTAVMYLIAVALPASAILPLSGIASTVMESAIHLLNWLVRTIASL